MDHATDSTSRFSWKSFVIGFLVNGAGVVLLEILQYIFGMLSFTDDVSVSLTALELAYWIWSPAPILFGLPGATSAAVPSISFLLFSGLTMATVAGFVVSLMRGRATGETRAEQGADAKPDNVTS